MASWPACPTSGSWGRSRKPTPPSMYPSQTSGFPRGPQHGELGQVRRPAHRWKRRGRDGRSARGSRLGGRTPRSRETGPHRRGGAGGGGRGGGMVAALAALDSGIDPLVVEKQALIGGATGMSGGMVWLPNNPLMVAEGIPDSHEDGLPYFDDVVGDIGAPSSPARREMFLTAGSEMLTFLLRKGIRLVRCPGWSDYYPNHKGGNAAGRSVEGIPYDSAALGDWSDKVQTMAKTWNRGFVVKTNELRSVQYFNRSPRAFAVAMRVFLRTRAARLRGREILTNGASLIGQMLKVLIDLRGDPPLWTNTAMDDLIVEGGRVVGARVTRDGSSLDIEARKGV